jgi:hypothetical protein
LYASSFEVMASIDKGGNFSQPLHQRSSETFTPSAPHITFIIRAVILRRIVYYFLKRHLYCHFNFAAMSYEQGH